ncbi:hypothetical protein AJ85_05740 [Alkalihalobacillus alcalophilus ATCC 27647 = CGMCC 1.3604]|uniref:Uncharacterized protein n=1 Tax=Alkalihalobacillus alcalophilus ATCC 27647 = CGMCC 1.3604 TaxID=1218173 RepID=A0A094WJ44_ALKAL|nr:hypothetical protein [Alkalihalobacillus alcalophilus]YP_009276823.1 hypothetical protein BH791_gp17 [Bacillus phage BalMu-1]AJA42395.1 hypothetical protein BalMu1_B17 [Bacillus phage BalMu-1]AJA42451.1 hypothetical protein BalMu1_A17 [Bacillus phage BalMu-1]KGA96851.1 hypothetical protein BALCAV_0213610 [Alkalihalobacillus alcalophilus ATCC 27647 = CGMCC 1.3604]MED1561139.1 hypothetical protein [Alkalihalobacillus alcalophilus]THG91325.1 hypothetical protein AJ85_05740 [Alkalihalobacillus
MAKPQTTARSGGRVKELVTPIEGVYLDVNKDVTGEELANLLAGITAFSSHFEKGDRYAVSIQLEKIGEPVEATK